MLMAYVFIATLIGAQGARPDPCINHGMLNDPERHSLVVKHQSDDLLCDRTLMEGWYRFHNADMPFNQCRQKYQCGTHVPLWINGSVPTVSEGVVSRTACGTIESDCCRIKTPMYVKNCGTFLVYYLKPVPACSMAYCTGDPLNCGKNQYSKTGFQPCQDGYPNLQGRPVLSKPIVANNGFEFTCQIPYPHNIADATFEVTWLVDGKPISGATTTLSGFQREAQLPGSLLAGNLNKDLSCAVKTSFSDGRTGGMTSPKTESNNYWVGIKLSSTSVTIDENHHKGQVSIISTIPIVCTVPGQTDCSVDFQLSYKQDLLVTFPCEVKLTPASWNQFTHTATTTFSIQTSPNLIPFQQTSQINLSVHGNGTGSMYGGQTLPSVQVHQTSLHPSGICISTGDPHIKTFDKSHRYNHFLIGQYTMVQRHRSSFRVEARTWKCGKVACNCGVAMREGNDVITVDMCHGRYGKAVARMSIKNPAMYENRTRIVKEPSGNGYVISFDSGANVKINIRQGRLLDLFITVPGTFYTDTEGLCGYFDGISGNDLTRKGGHVDSFNKQPNHFIQSWSIPAGQSLFEKAEPLPASQNPCQRPNPVGNLCPTCVPVTPPPQVLVTTPPIPGTTPSGPNIRPTSPTGPVTPASYHFVTSGPNPTPDLTPLVDKANATKRCNDILQKYPSARQCTTKGFYVDYSIILNMCVADIQMTNDNDMAISSLSSLIQQCAHEIMIKNSTVENGTITWPSLALTCLGACSGNGDCHNGTCVCDKGFAASDCSVDMGKPPILTDVLKNPCDINVEECFGPILIGSNMLNSVESTCFVSYVSNSSKRGYVYQQPSPQRTQFYSTNHVKCPLPIPDPGKTTGQFAISLANQKGQPQSNAIIYHVYNSKCQECDMQFHCSIKNGTCRIDNLCYLKGEKNPTNDKQTCDPDKSPSIWTSVNSGTGTANIYTLPIILPGLSTSPTTAKPGGQGNSNILTLPPILPGGPATSKPGGNGNSAILTLPPILPGASKSCDLSNAQEKRHLQAHQKLYPPQQSEAYLRVKRSRSYCYSEPMRVLTAFNMNSFLASCPEPTVNVFQNDTLQGFGGNVDYTKSGTGCECHFDNSRTDCACCQNFGCQCPQNKQNFCHDCLNTTTCGK